LAHCDSFHFPALRLSIGTFHFGATRVHRTVVQRECF
jgi:hypothetical protein